MTSYIESISKKVSNNQYETENKNTSKIDKFEKNNKYTQCIYKKNNYSEKTYIAQPRKNNLSPNTALKISIAVLLMLILSSTILILGSVGHSYTFATSILLMMFVIMVLLITWDTLKKIKVP